MHAIICILEFMNFMLFFKKFIKFKQRIKFKKFELHNYGACKASTDWKYKIHDDGRTETNTGNADCVANSLRVATVDKTAEATVVLFDCWLVDTGHPDISDWGKTVDVFL